MAWIIDSLSGERQYDYLGPMITALAVALVVPALLQNPAGAPQEARPRLREAGITIGNLEPGPLNAITDVAGVQVGHATLIEGDNIRTGVTVILPHGGNLFREKVPAAVYVGNAFGKLMGSTQVQELGNIEAPIALTNTLNVGLVADALIGYMLGQEDNESVRSINVVVGETNDGGMNDIRGRHVREKHVLQALANAASGPVQEGSVGAGTGTSAFGWKGGIGSSSRITGDYTVGVLVQSNFGGSLTVAGVPVYRELQRPGRRGREEQQEYGSCMMVVATDAPLDSRNLERLAMRALAGMARTGASFSNGSGDFVISFSTAESQRITGGATTGGPVLDNGRMSGLFRAAAEACEEAILNSMFKATAVSGRGQPLPVEQVVEIVKRHGG